MLSRSRGSPGAPVFHPKQQSTSGALNVRRARVALGRTALNFVDFSSDRVGARQPAQLVASTALALKGDDMLRRKIGRHVVAWLALTTISASAMIASPPQSGGQHDFDWELGTWTTHVRVLRNPLSGEPPVWASYQGTSVVKPLMGGRANFVELSVSGPAGAIEGGALRLYNPKARQWSLNYASLAGGMLTAPLFGTFDHSGKGTFIGQDQLGGRAILVRFIITRPSAKTAQFEQSYSADGGSTWETNWVALDSRS